MIYKCDNCVNRNNCPENKDQYERTCNTLRDVARGLDKLPEYRSYYSLEIKCDYWVEDKATLCKVCDTSHLESEQECDSEPVQIELLPCPVCHNVPSIGYLSSTYHLNGECMFCNDTKFKSYDELTLTRNWNTLVNHVRGSR